MTLVLALLLAQDRVTFVSDREGTRDIYVVKADGTGVRNLTLSPAEEWYPSWSPDGKLLLFTSNRDKSWDIYLMDGRRDVRRLTAQGWNGNARFSPDGKRIVFHSSRDENWEIYAMKADGSGQTNLTQDAAADRHPCWSPDGSKIAFESDRRGDVDVWVMAADGSGAKALAAGDGFDGAPSWSPDGRKIAFHSNRDGNEEIYVMDADGTNVARLTENDANDRFPAWSPDGKRLAFHSDRGGNVDVWIMDADGRNARNLTKHAADDGFSPPAFGGAADFARAETPDEADTVEKMEAALQGPRTTLGTVRDALQHALAFGVPAYNNGDIEACARVYAKAASLVAGAKKPSAGAAAAVDGIRAAADRAAEEKSAARRAWMLRYAFDRAALAADLRAGEARMLVRLATDQFNRGFFPEAEDASRDATAIVEDLVGSTPETLPLDARLAPLSLSHALFAQGKFAGAGKALRRLPALLPEAAKLQFKRPGMQAGYDERLADLEKEAKESDDADVHAQLGYEYFFGDRREDAAKCFEKALKLDAEHKGARMLWRSMRKVEDY